MKTKDKTPNLTLEELYAEIEKLGLHRGSEPSYLKIKTPIADDTAGWWISLEWMHHDGEITEAISRGATFNEAAVKIVDLLYRMNTAEFDPPLTD